MIIFDTRPGTINIPFSISIASFEEGVRRLVEADGGNFDALLEQAGRALPNTLDAKARPLTEDQIQQFIDDELRYGLSGSRE